LSIHNLEVTEISTNLERNENINISYVDIK